MRCCQPLLSLLFIAIFTLLAPWASAKEVETLEIGAAAPELNLPGVDDKTYRLDDFADANVLVVIFTCYTILIAPGGKIVRRGKSEVDPRELKSEISNLLGKTYATRQ